MDKISIICPIYNEEKYIADCIESIINQDIDKTNIELLLVDGMSNDNTRNIVLDYNSKYPWIQLLDNPQKIVPTAMNIGINTAIGDIIVRIDAHAEFPTNYVSELVKQLKVLGADNVGAICETLPANESLEAKAIATALSSSFGMGNSYFRIGASKVMEVDTVPFGCFKKSTFDKVGLYDEELIRNQDDELNARIIKYGGKIYLIPNIIVKYFARDTIKKTRKMFYQYGLYKPLVNKKLGSPATIRQFFPMLFVLGLIFGAFFSFIHPIFMYIYTFVIGLYLIGAIYFSLKDSKDKAELLLLPYVFLNIHLGYGWGYLVGIYKVLTGKDFNVKINR
ncbi:glycosyltransferase family 2 protein [Myroides odoratimimus]|uniref:glycosyltransferase family 2 protein n=1 Tax=Myroides odoratimimus TaxID=76832 RepID=UPI003F42C212